MNLPLCNSKFISMHACLEIRHHQAFWKSLSAYCQQTMNVSLINLLFDTLVLVWCKNVKY